MTPYFQVENDDTVLVHYGIKGMKWGVRRYQNKDGSLTPAGKRRVSKEYTKRMKRANSYAKRTHNKRWLKSYNKAANYINTGGMEEFNRTQAKKYGKDFAKRDDYAKEYSRFFNEKLAEYYNISLYSALRGNKNYVRSQELVKKYSMDKWNDSAKAGFQQAEELRRDAEKAMKSVRRRR